MRIVIDLQSCQSGSRFGGIGRGSLALSKAMIRQPRDHEYWVVLNSLLPEAIPEIRKEFRNLLPPDRIRVIHLPGPIAECKADNHTRRQAAALIREQFLCELQPDMIHISSFIEGFYEDVSTSAGLLTSSERTAATLYDLIPYVEQELYIADPLVRTHYMRKVDALTKLGLLLSISEFSRQEAIDLLGLRPQSVVTMSLAADSFFHPISVSEDSAASIRAMYGIRKNFLLYTSSYDQRKNHESLIRAFASLPVQLRSSYQLVFVGNGWDAMYRQLRQVAEAEGMAPHELVFAGKVADDQLLYLYNMCSLFVFPSIREGFGLPILEAMSCGIPAIGSNTTSIPEVIGMKEALFDPRSVSSIGQKIYECLTNKDLYNKIANNALPQSLKFSWERSAQITLDAFEGQHEALNHRVVEKSLHGQTNRSNSHTGNSSTTYRRLIQALSHVDGISLSRDDELARLSRCVARNLSSVETIHRARTNEQSPVRIGWVTTWKTRCGIAESSAPLLKAIPAQHHVFAPYLADVTEAEGDNISRSWKLGGNDDLTSLARAVEERDIDVIVVQFVYAFFDMPALSNFLKAQIAAGRVVLVILHSTQDPPPEALDRKLSQISEALSGCHLFAHTDSDVSRIQALGLQNVSYIPLGIHENEPSMAGLPEFAGKFVIGTYGFALPNKGLMELLEAFAQLASEDERLHLLMVNAEFPNADSKALIQALKERIAALQLDARVTLVNDFLSNEDSLAYLRRADLIVIPYQQTYESGSSGSARMALAAGRPVAVTPLEFFDDIRTFVFTLPGTSVEALATGISGLIVDIRSDNSTIRSVSNSARTWAHTHRFGGVGRYLFSEILMLLEDHPQVFSR